MLSDHVAFFVGAACSVAAVPEVSSSVKAATSARRIFLPPSMLYQPGLVVISGFLPFAASYAASNALKTSVLSSLLIVNPSRVRSEERV